MLKAVKNIVDNRLFEIHFQPIFDLETGSVFGREALLRGPDGPFQRPDSLLRAAKRLGLASDLDLAVCSKVASLPTGPGLRFVNLTPGTFLDRAEEVRGILPPGTVVEVTESLGGVDLDPLAGAVRSFRETGFLVALDDLASAGAWNGILFRARPDFAKIDKDLVQAASSSSVKLAALRCLRARAEACGSRVVAEGIETGEQLETVISAGIRYGQGFLLGVPEPVPDKVVKGGLR